MPDEKTTKELFELLDKALVPTNGIQRLLDAYGKAISTYYETEREFYRKPTAENLHRYHIALDRLNVLRGEAAISNRIGDALEAREPNISDEPA